MNRIPHLSCRAVHRFALLLGIGALTLCGPTPVRASDPVEALREALKINFEGDRPLQEKQRPEKIAKAINDLKTITQLRRAYFLKEWPQARPEVPDPATDIEKYRKSIGAAVLERIGKAGIEPNVDRQIAAAMLIAELADDRDQPVDRSPTGKFASVFTDLLIGGGKAGPGLVRSDNVILRQAGLHALGKITPRPTEVFPAAGKYRPFEAALNSPEVGPRRLAAFALGDLVSNAHYLDVTNELKTHEEAVKTAILPLSKPGEDEIVRGYALQAIQASANIFTDYPVSPGTAIHFDALGEKKVLNPNVAAILKAYQQASPRLVAALDDPSADIRLTALEALAHIVSARMKIMDKFYETQKDLLAEKRSKRDEIFAVFKSPDPISYLFQMDKSDPAAPKWHWEAVPGLLKKDESVRVRRGAMALLEMVADDVDAALEANKIDKKAKLDMRRRFVQSITPGLRDPDNIVRWSAARTVRHVSLDLVDAAIVEALGEMLIEPSERDPDPSSAAAATLQMIAASPYAPRAIRYLKSVIADQEKDVELRESAIATLVLIGGDEANAAFPELTSVLTDGDVRIRRAATEALGQLARPATRQVGETALAALRQCLRDDDPQVRRNASEAILSIVLPR